MKTNVLLLLLITVLSNTSCKKNEEATQSNFSSMDFNDAKLVFLTNDGANLSTLYKIKSDNTIEKVKCFDQNAKEISANTNLYIISNANSNFMLLRYDVYTPQGYLLRKSDGTVKALTYAPITSNGDAFANNVLSQNDGSLNIYYRGFTAPYNVVKINTVNPNLISESVVSDATISVRSFNIDAWDNIAFSGTNPSLTQYIYKISKFLGGIAIVPTAINYNPFWVGKNGNFYYMRSDNNRIDSANYNSTSNAFTFGSYYDNSISIPAQTNGVYHYDYGTVLLFVNRIDNKIYEVENSTNTPRIISSIGQTDIVLSDMSYLYGYLYIYGKTSSGKSNIFKVDLNNNYAFTTLTTDDKYEVSDMEVFEDGTVYFLAQRLSDGKYVVAKIDITGTETILDETVNKPAFELEKVSEFIPE